MKVCVCSASGLLGWGGGGAKVGWRVSFGRGESDGCCWWVTVGGFVQRLAGCWVTCLSQ